MTPSEDVETTTQLQVIPVDPHDERAFAEWFAEFDSEAADEADLMALFGDGVFGAGLGALKTKFAG